MRRKRGFATAGILLAALLSMAGLTSAQTPPSGWTITTEVTFNGDLDATGHTGTVLTIGADDSTLDGAGYTMHAPDSTLVIHAASRSGVTITGIQTDPSAERPAVLVSSSTDVSVTNSVVAGCDVGVHLLGAGGASVTGCDVSGCDYGSWISNADECLVQGNDCRDCAFGIVAEDCGYGNRFLGNDLAAPGYGIDLLSQEGKG